MPIEIFGMSFRTSAVVIACFAASTQQVAAAELDVSYQQLSNSCGGSMPQAWDAFPTGSYTPGATLAVKNDSKLLSYDGNGTVLMTCGFSAQAASNFSAMSSSSSAGNASFGGNFGWGGDKASGVSDAAGADNIRVESKSFPAGTPVTVKIGYTVKWTITGSETYIDDYHLSEANATGGFWLDYTTLAGAGRGHAEACLYRHTDNFTCSRSRQGNQWTAKGVLVVDSFVGDQIGINAAMATYAGAQAKGDADLPIGADVAVAGVSSITLCSATAGVTLRAESGYKYPRGKACK